MPAMSDQQPPFETTLARLREVVERLEAGGEPLPLEESLELFEEGVRLARAATSALEGAEQRVEVLLADGTTEPLPDPSP